MTEGITVPNRRAGLLCGLLVACGGTPAPLAPAPKSVPSAPPPVTSELPLDETIAAAYQPAIRTLVAGADFTCGLRGGVAHCWGGNGAGQLGDGGRGYRFGPVKVAVDEIVSLAAGGASVCARVRDGGVTCWGEMGGDEGAPRDLGRKAQHVAVSGQQACLVYEGDVTCMTAEEVHAVEGLDDAAAVVVHGGGGCARTARGTVACWSDSTDEAYVAEPVEGLSEVVRLAAHEYETCALRASPDDEQRTVLCWAPGSTNLSSPIVEPTVLTRDLHLGRGWGCLEARDGLTCWGRRPDTSGHRYDAQDPSFDLIVGAVALAAGDGHLCGQLSSGDTLCVGKNDREQLGVPSGLVQPRPQAIAKVSGAADIVSGPSHACTVGTETICWGHEDIRLGRYGASSPHVLEPPLMRPTAMAAGAHTCAISGGKLTCWGDGGWGQLGDEGGAPPKPKPARAVGALGALRGHASPARVYEVKGLGTVTSVAAGEASTCAVEGGRVSCWGRLFATAELHGDPCTELSFGVGALGGLGMSPPPKPTRTPAQWCEELKKPHPVAGTQGATEVVSLDGGFCALVSHAVQCWSGEQLQAGLRPRVVPGLKRPTKLFGGSGEVCARHDEGVACWSYETMFPRPPEGLSDVLGGGEVVQIATGTDHACAVDAQGRVICWGSNGAGQLGRAEGVEPPEPEDPDYAPPRRREAGAPLGAAVVVGLPPARAVATGDRHSCALSRQGQVHCWGGPRLMLGGGDVVTESNQPLLVEGWP